MFFYFKFEFYNLLLKVVTSVNFDKSTYFDVFYNFGYFIGFFVAFSVVWFIWKNIKNPLIVTWFFIPLCMFMLMRNSDPRYAFILIPIYAISCGFVFQKIQKKYITAILSNADNDDPLIKILLKKGFKFDSIVTSESVKAYKPRSIVFEKVLTEISCNKDHVVLVGDSQISDILGAKDFGIKVIWLNRRNELLKENVPQPDYQISNLSQLFDIIEI